MSHGKDEIIIKFQKLIVCTAYLNRPVITLLSHGGVPDDTILEMQEKEINLLANMLESDEDAKKTIRAIGSQFDTGFVAEQMLQVCFFGTGRLRVLRVKRRKLRARNV